MAMALMLHCVPVRSAEAGASSSWLADEAPEGQSVEPRAQTPLDTGSNADLHNDNTVLRNVELKLEDDSRELSIGPLTLWLGGNIEYDLYHFDDIYNYGAGGSGDAGQQIRRLEGTVRARYRDWGEIKAEYDAEAGDWTDLYLRWVSRLTPRPHTITLGNQKEPMGLSWLSGDLADTAQELATPVAAFADWRSLGLRVHRAFGSKAGEREFGFWRGDDAAITTSLGVFTEDINNTNGTDLAVTGRVTAGRIKGDTGSHLGMAASIRSARGNYDKISFRPEIYEADRIELARPDADELLIGSLEAAHTSGRLQLQAEAYLADYSGAIDGYGGGGYVQLGWFVAGEPRQYQTDWGVFARPQPRGNDWIVEVFARGSYTRGEDDINGWNAFNSLTLGANVYFRRLRGSVNMLYGKATDPVASEDDGLGVVARAQFLF